MSKKHLNNLLLVFFFTFGSVISVKSTTLDSLENQFNLPYPYISNSSSNLFMNQNSYFTQEIIYDEKNNQYLIQRKIGDIKIGFPKVLSFQEFQEFNFNNSISEYWNKRSKDRSSQKNTRMGIPKLYIPGQALSLIHI